MRSEVLEVKLLDVKKCNQTVRKKVLIKLQDYYFKYLFCN